jgi:post-segregation antitoxin (ccd killing protein)
MKGLITINVDTELIKLARERGLNISGTLNRLLRDYFKLDKILEEQRLNEEITRLQTLREQQDKEKEDYENAKQNQIKELLQELEKNDKWNKFIKNYNPQTTPDEIMEAARELRLEGFKVGFSEIQKVLELIKNG